MSRRSIPDPPPSSATVTTAATCTTPGVRTYACACGESYTEAIPATGHSYVRTEENGNYVYTCSACGEVETRVIPAAGHDYKDGKCTVCGATDPGYQPTQPGVKTGDESNTTLWVMLLTVSALLAAAVVVLPRKKHTR